MGVNARWYPPVGTKLEHVRDVIAVICGAKVVMEPLSDSGPLCAQYRDEEGMLQFFSRLVKAEATSPSVPGMVTLSWDLPLSGQQGLWWHYESEVGRPLTCPRSRGFYNALLLRLCNFFGGDLQFSDCDDIFDVTDAQPWFLEPDGFSCTVERSDEKYAAYQRALSELSPLTLGDLEYGEAHADYPGDLAEMRHLFAPKSRSILSEPVTTRKPREKSSRGLLTD